MNRETEKCGCPSGKGSKDHIKGICCDVKNCVYHDCETYCTAEQIAVGPSSATSSADTACATFKERK
ncbi:MAG: DUF1540 domain-containing protein [Ruminococcaceae bacterium]|nr:DUF1540 domain-containing protein [Oscillospiraceae bacterium]